MLKRIKKFFKKSPIKDNRGSVMSVALIVITILTFSMTSITTISVNLAGATKVKLAQVNEENTGKGTILQSISELKEYIESEGSITALDEVLATLTAYDKLTVSDVTDDLDYDPDDDFGNGNDGPAGHESRIYKFAYELADGELLVKLAYVSNGGTAVAELNPFDFSLSTNEKLILNGGYYDEITLYGNDVLLASVAPYIQSGTTNTSITPTNSAVYPVLTPNTVASLIYATASYQYCETGDTCYTTSGSSNPFVIVESNYQDVDGSTLVDQGEFAEETISDFFGTFDYDEFAIDYIQNEAGTDSRVVSGTIDNLADAAVEVLADSDPIEYKGNGQPKKPLPTTAFIDITNDSNWDFSEVENFKDFSPVYNGDVTIAYDVKLKDDECLFIIGDLTIDYSGTQILDLEGTFVVTGNLYFTGNDVDIEGTFFVFGETYMNFDDDEGIITQGNNDGLSLLSKDNIIIEEIYVSHVNSTAPVQFSAFFYTEESIFIDAVNSKFHMEGSLFARGLGVSGNEIFLNDGSAIPVEGIMINSYRGYINTSGVAVPTTADSTNRFNIAKIPQANYQSKFRNIPVFDTLISNIDNWSIFTGEFFLE